MDTLLTQLRISHDDLETEKYLGTGAFGAVFLGLWKSKNCKVAIKMIHVDGKEMLGVICNELNGMVALRFKHICQLYGVSIVSDEELWMVLEYVDGPNLHDFLVSNGPVSWDIQLSFALQAAKALHYLHTLSPPLLHKDIKSLSIIVDVNAKTIKLTDFGLSKAPEFVTSQTNVIGSLRWAAPEVIKVGKEKWSEKADIYSLGMVFFEVLSCEFPFRYDSNFASISKKIKRGVRPLIPQHCPDKFAEIMCQCWDSDPQNRPSAQELVNLLIQLESESTRGPLVRSSTNSALKCNQINFSTEKTKSCVIQ